MTVLCVNSTVVYADIAAADAAEGGTDYGVPTRFEQTGTSSSAVGFSSGDYLSEYIYTATAGEETTGDIAVGAQMTALISMADTGTISNLRTGRINLNFSTNSGSTLLSLVVDGGGTNDPVVFAASPSYTFTNVLVFDSSDAFRGITTNDNAIATNCTAVDATGFGVLRPRAVDCVSLNTGSAAYIQIGASSSNYWADDGTGSDAITEGTPTDIFEDYAGGDYRIKASSSVGAAGAGAFINAAGTPTVTPDISATATLTLSKVVTFANPFSYSANAAPSIAKQVGKNLSYSATASSYVAKKVEKNLSYTATGTATQDEGLVTPIALSYTATGLLSTAAQFIAKGTVVVNLYIRRIAAKIGIGL